MLYIIQLSFFALLTIFLALVTIACGIFETHGKKAYRINQFWTWIILRVGGIRLSIDGLENIDPQRSYIFVVNHQSNIDIPVLVQALPGFQLRWIAKKELLHVPFFGWAMWATKHVTIDRSDPQDAVKSLILAKARLGAGISLVVYPEGTRSRDGRLQRFKKGGFLLAVQANTPIVPVTVRGSARVLPIGAWRLRRGIIAVTIDKPVSVEGFRPGNLRLLVNQVHATIEARLRAPERPSAHDEIFEDRVIGPKPIEKPSV
jgi:1-acyl-sn-glycerol-3-phosphate acyltransferase